MAQKIVRVIREFEVAQEKALQAKAKLAAADEEMTKVEERRKAEIGRLFKKAGVLYVPDELILGAVYRAYKDGPESAAWQEAVEAGGPFRESGRPKTMDKERQRDREAAASKGSATR